MDATAARSQLYRLLADGLVYPSPEFFATLQAGRYRDALLTQLQVLGYDAELTDGLVASGRYLDFQAEYLRFFEVGLGVPPCPLYSGIYRGGRKAVMEELTRFYNYFGLSSSQGGGELPDHLSTELEFMHFLTFKELAARERDEDADSYRRAQADFLERHLVSWLSALERRLAGLTRPPFYAALVWLTRSFTADEYARLRRTLTPVPVAQGA